MIKPGLVLSRPIMYDQSSLFCELEAQFEKLLCWTGSHCRDL